MAWRIDEKQSWRFEFLSSKHCFTRFVQNFSRDFSRSDVLSDATSLTVHDACLAFAANRADQIQNACFSMINMATDRDNWLAVMTTFDGHFIGRILFGFVHAITSNS